MNPKHIPDYGLHAEWECIKSITQLVTPSETLDVSDLSRGLRIPRDGDQCSELMSITIPK